MEEIWKEIPGFKHYHISSLGRIKSLSRTIVTSTGVVRITKDIILKQSKCNHGYNSVCLTINKKKHSKRIHKLVAMAFLNHIPCKMKQVVDHIDNDKSNNNLENLKLTTQRDNASKDKKNKTSKFTGVHWDKQRNKYVARIRNGNKVFNLGGFKCELEASKAYQYKLKEINAL